MDIATADRVAFFDLLRDGHTRAAAAVGGYVDRHYRIAGARVRVRFAGPALVPLFTPALAHLEISERPAGENPSLTILAWESEATQTRPPARADAFIQRIRAQPGAWVTPRSELIGFNDDRIRAVFQLYPDVLNVYDIERNTAVLWVESASGVRYWEWGRPFQVQLHWWATRRKQQLVHAGAVGHADGGVLVVGRGGKGKSTTCLACLDSDLLYAGDDYCLLDVETEPPEPFVHSLYNTAKLVGEADFARFPRLAAFVHNRNRAPDEKAMLFLHAHMPEKLSAGFPVRAIVAPSVTDKPRTTLTPLGRALALRALAPTTISQLPGASHNELSGMATLARSVPAYALELGADISNVPCLISELLRI